MDKSNPAYSDNIMVISRIELSMEKTEVKTLSLFLTYNSSYIRMSGSESDSGSEYQLDSDVESVQKSAKVQSFLNDSDFDSDSDDEKRVFDVKKKTSIRREDQESDDEEEVYEEEEEGEDDEDNEEIGDLEDEEIGSFDEDEIERLDNTKLKKLSPEKLKKEQARIRKTGVCYLASIPPFMKPAKVRSICSYFGRVDRLFLTPESQTTYRRRVKYGGNKKKNFTEGWIEFVNKKHAKLCATTLNGKPFPGKKGSRFYGDLVNIKYLKNYKWSDLTQQIATANEAREAKLTLELSHQKKLNSNYIQNVEKSKTIKHIQQKRKAKDADANASEDSAIRRVFKQRRVTSTRADAKEELKVKSKPSEKLTGVLSHIF